MHERFVPSLPGCWEYFKGTRKYLLAEIDIIIAGIVKALASGLDFSGLFSECFAIQLKDGYSKGLLLLAALLQTSLVLLILINRQLFHHAGATTHDS